LVFYSNNSSMIKLINNFSHKTNSKSIHISKVNNFCSNQDDVFFIPIYGEEELNDEWESFLKKYADNPINIGKNTCFYLYGIYDLEIDKNTTIVKQINDILQFLSIQLNIFPLKIIQNYTLLDTLVYYYKHTYKNNHKNDLINKIIFFSKQYLIQNDLHIINLTSKYDEYSSVIDHIKIKNKKTILIELLSNTTVEYIILNRVKSINMNKFLKKIKNNTILKLQLKSNKLQNIESLSGFIALEYLNLTANFFKIINIDKLPKTINSLNISKNFIHEIKIKKKYKIKKLIVFNNKITDMSFLMHLADLEYLNIGLNPIKKFPDEICKLKKLIHLNISYLNINLIPKEILKLKKLKTIDITGTQILNSFDIITKLQNNGIKIIS